MMGKVKPIWRLAFFSRLEERKGIKLFVDAVSALNVTDEKFEVHSLTPKFIPARTKSRKKMLLPHHGYCGLGSPDKYAAVHCRGRCLQLLYAT